MEKIYKTMKLEDFFGDISNNLENKEYNYGNLIEKLRNAHSARKIKTKNNNVVRIVNGVYSGNKAEIITCYEEMYCLKIYGDRYNNIIKVHIKDLEHEELETQTVYILE